MPSPLQQEIVSFRTGLGGIMNRLCLVADALEADPNNPDPHTVQGAAAVLQDAIKGLDTTIGNVTEESELADYLEAVFEEAEVQE